MQCLSIIMHLEGWVSALIYLSIYILVVHILYVGVSGVLFSDGSPFAIPWQVPLHSTMCRFTARPTRISIVFRGRHHAYAAVFRIVWAPRQNPE